MLKSRKIKFIALALALTLLITSSGIPVHATELSENNIEVFEEVQFSDKDTASARAMTYESVWLDTGGSGSFKVHTDISGKTNFTLKIESITNNSWANINIQKPDGSYLFGKNISLNPGNPEGVYYILGGIPGDYTIHYNAGTDKGMRIMCWIY